MKKDIEIALAIKNEDFQRKNFFIGRLKGDLKRYALQVDEEHLNELFDKAIDQFIETEKNVGFYYFCFGFIRKELEKESSNTYVPNTLFSRAESIIIQKYLDLEHGFANSQDIANELGISITEVSNTIYRFKETLLSEKKEVLRLFPTAITIISQREEIDNALIRKRKKETNDFLSSERALELIGYYTGQIDDICLGIDELAKKYYTASKIIEKQLKDIIVACKDPNFYNTILKRYPSIEDMLVVKAKALGVSFKSKTRSTEKKERKAPPKAKKENDDGKKLSAYEEKSLHFLQALYQRKADGSFFSETEVAAELNLEFNSFKRKRDYLYKKLEDKEFREKILAYYPNLFTDMKEFHGGSQTNSKIIDSYLSFLSTIYQVQEDKSFYPISDSLEKLHIRRKTYDKRRMEIYQAFDGDIGVKATILETIPDFVEKRKNYEQFISSLEEDADKSDSDTTSKKALMYAEFFKALYTKDVKGHYPSTAMLAEQFQITKQNVAVRKTRFLENMEKREKLKRDVLKRYPSLYEDKKRYDESLDDKSDSSTLDVDQSVSFCQYIYKTQIQGKYLSYSSLAKKRQIPIASFYRQRNLILNAFNEDENFQKEFSSKYPEFLQDKQLYEEAHAQGDCLRDREKGSVSIDDYAQLLRAYYEEKRDGTYHTLVSLEDVFHLSQVGVANRKKKILDLIKSDSEMEKQVLQLYPTLYEDMAIRKAVKSHKNGKINTIDVSLGKKIAQKYVCFLRDIYHEGEEHLSLECHAQKLGYTKLELSTKIKRIFTIISNEKNIRKFFYNLYSNLEGDMQKFETAEQALRNQRVANEKAKIYSDFLRGLYHKRINGSYIAHVDLYAYLRKMSMPNLLSARCFILEEMERNHFLRDEILRLYPTLYEDKKQYEEYNAQIETGQKIPPKESSFTRTVKHPRNYQSKLNLLKLYYQENSEGNYYSMQEIAELLDMNYASACNKRIHVERLLSEDKDFKAYILKNYPTVFEDIQSRNRLIKAKDYARFLKVIYQKKEDGTYRNTNEIIELLHINLSNFYIKRKRVLTLLDSDPKLRDRIIVEYPTLVEDQKAYQLYQDDLTKNEKEVADTFLVDKTREITTYTSLAKKICITSQFVKILEENALIKMGNNPLLQKNYPTAMLESNIRRNSSKKNTVPISLEELERIADDSNRFSDQKSALVKGIHLLENSIYKDFVQSCTPQQKAMLALRLGFFNHTIFGSQDIAEMFHVSQEEVASLTEECFKVCGDTVDKVLQKKKKL